MAGLKSWRELLETPLKGDEKPSDDEMSLRKCEIPETGGFPSSGIPQKTPMKNSCEIPEKFPPPVGQRCFILGCMDWTVDIAYCAEHRRMADDGSLCGGR